MYDFIKSLNLKEELKKNEIYSLFKSDSSEINLDFISSLQKFNTTEELLNYYTKENSKDILNIFNNLSSIPFKIYNQSEENLSEKYISKISKIIFLFLLIQKNIELLCNILKQTKKYVSKFYKDSKIKNNNIIDKIYSCINDLFSYLIDSQKNYSRRSTKDNSFSSLKNELSNSYLNDDEYIFPEVKTPRFEEEEEEYNTKENNFEYIKEAINNEDKLKKVDSSLTLSKMNFVMTQELEPVAQLEKRKSHEIYKKPNNSKKNSRKNNQSINKKIEKLIFNKKDFLWACLNEITNLYKEKKINSNKKIELKQLIISDYNDISLNFYNFYEENNSISDNIKNFLISNFIKEI